MGGAKLDVPDSWKIETGNNVPEEFWPIRFFGYSAKSLVNCAMDCYNHHDCFAFQYKTNPRPANSWGVRAAWINGIERPPCAMLFTPPGGVGPNGRQKFNGPTYANLGPERMPSIPEWRTPSLKFTPGYISGLKTCLKGKSREKLVCP